MPLASGCPSACARGGIAVVGLAVSGSTDAAAGRTWHTGYAVESAAPSVYTKERTPAFHSQTFFNVEKIAIRVPSGTGIS